MNDLLGLVKQCQRDSERWFPNIANDIPFTVLALCGETGEMANIAKKVVRGSVSLENVAEHLGEEAVDVLIYLCMVFAQLGIDPVAAYKEKRAKNELRFGKGPLTDTDPDGTGIPGYVPLYPDTERAAGDYAAYDAVDTYGRCQHWGPC